MGVHYLSHVPNEQLTGLEIGLGDRVSLGTVLLEDVLDLFWTGQSQSWHPIGERDGVMDRRNGAQGSWGVHLVEFYELFC